MKKPRLATMWLDGCSGCHMSLLDVDEGIIMIAAKADLLEGFAQRRRFRACVGRIDGAAGKGHLPRMAAQLFGPLRQKNRRIAVVVRAKRTGLLHLAENEDPASLGHANLFTAAIVMAGRTDEPLEALPLQLELDTTGWH